MSTIEEQIHKNFPMQEQYIDCSGKSRTFELYLDRALNPGFLLSAREITESECSYKFSVYSEADPFDGFGRLRGKIRRELSRRYLIGSGEKVSMSHNELAGTISHGGLIVDGQLLPWNKLQEQLLTHEGFHINLSITSGDE